MKELFNLKHITKGPITTILGVVILAVSLYQHTAGNWSDTAIGLTIGLFLLFLPDKKKGSGTTGPAAMLLLLLFSSCVTAEKCTAKFGSQTDTVEVEVKVEVPIEVKVPVPPDSLSVRLQLDSLLAAKVGDTLKIISRNGRAEVRFWKDKYNNYLHSQLNVLRDTIPYYDTIPYKVLADVPAPQHYIAPLSWWEKAWLKYQEAAAFIVVGLFVSGVVVLIFKR